MVGLLKKAFPFLAMVPMVRLCAQVLSNGPSIASHKEEQQEKSKMKFTLLSRRVIAREICPLKAILPANFPVT